MGLNTDYLKKGDRITLEKWLKKMGHVKMSPDDTKTRNALALVRKGKFVAAKIVGEHDADTIVNYNGEMTPFKRIGLDEIVTFDEDRICVFPKDLWSKATRKNLFLGILDRAKETGPGGIFFNKEEGDGLDPELPEISS